MQPATEALHEGEWKHIEVCLGSSILKTLVTSTASASDPQNCTENLYVLFGQVQEVSA